jgi:hypothetical protein
MEVLFQETEQINKDSHIHMFYSQIRVTLRVGFPSPSDQLTFHLL